MYLFDEFDAIGSQRGMENEVGEQRRILNTFLQLLDRDSSHSLMLAATNNIEILDKALFRKFDDVIEYKLPMKEQIVPRIKEEFCNFHGLNFYPLAERMEGMSQAEIRKVCNDAMKSVILDGRVLIGQDVISAIEDTKSNSRQLA